MHFRKFGPKYPLNFIASPDSFLVKRQKEYPGIVWSPYNFSQDMDDDIFKDLYEKDEYLKREQDNFLQVNIRKMIPMLHSVFSYPRSFLNRTDLRHGSADYITRRLGTMGLLVSLQSFKPNRFLKLFPNIDVSSQTSVFQTLPLGMNIFGVLPGDLWGTSMDKVIILGAHWDTMPKTAGFNDNGSGVAGVLEIARVLTSNNCRSRHSIIFAFFDLEEVGAQGSVEFVRNYLVANVLKRFNQSDIGGSFILDTLMNFNATEGSQEIPDGLADTDIDAKNSILKNGNRGDFVALIQRHEDEKLTRIFRKHFHHSQLHEDDKKHRALPIRIKLAKGQTESSGTINYDLLSKYVFFIRSDHSRFWVTGSEEFPALKSVLITDTGTFFYRQVS